MDARPCPRTRQAEARRAKRSGGPLRAAATQIVDHGGERVDAARLTSLVINALPENGRAPETARQTAWNQAAPATASFGGKAVAMAREVHDNCQASTTVGFGTMRQCLSSAHDIFMGKLNKKYWDAVKTGS